MDHRNNLNKNHLIMYDIFINDIIQGLKNTEVRKASKEIEDGWIEVKNENNESILYLLLRKHKQFDAGTAKHYWNNHQATMNFVKQRYKKVSYVEFFIDEMILTKNWKHS